jgi:hypothetical protein
MGTFLKTILATVLAFSTRSAYGSNISQFFPGGSGGTSSSLTIDQLLANIEDTAQKINISTSDENLLFKDAQEWRAALQEALNNNEVSIACFPARRFSGELLHQEALLRIKLKGDIYSARTVLGWAKRAGLLPQIELKVIQLALEYISIHRTPVAVNISMALLLEGQSYA